MFSHIFLGVTAGELAEFCPSKAAYMACHFSPYGTGLSNLPQSLPKGSIILLDDSTPPRGHEPKQVQEQLLQLIDRFHPEAVILDFQGEKTAEHTAMAEHLVHTLPCTVAVTEMYAGSLGCPVFLAPPPANKGLITHLGLWTKQGVYLEIAPMAVQITVTEDGCTSMPIPFPKNLPLQDTKLHCHYNIESFPKKAVFTLCRTKEDLHTLVQQAKDLGVLGCVGLYQELIRL